MAQEFGQGPHWQMPQGQQPVDYSMGQPYQGYPAGYQQAHPASGYAATPAMPAGAARPAQASQAPGAAPAPNQPHQVSAASPTPNQQPPVAGFAAVAAPAFAPQPKRHGWIVALVAIIALAAVCLFGIGSCTLTAGSLLGSGSSDSSSLAHASEDTIAVIYLEGEIGYNGTLCSPEGLKYALDLAEANDSVKAVVIRVDSGGGLSTAGEEMTNYLREFSKPVVVSVASMNCSAAYEITSQADYLFANKTSNVGAIGTYLQVVDYSDLLDALGIGVDNISSVPGKDSSQGVRPLTEEERAYYQDMVNQINDDFIANVAEGRGMSIEEVRALATGMPFTGLDAVENGLIDDIGQLEEALAKAAELSGLSEGYAVLEVRDASSGYDVYDLLGSNTVITITAGDLASALKELS